MSRTAVPVFSCSCPEGWKPEGWAYCAECYEGKIERLTKALGLFLATDETMEGILWGQEPDTALVKISIPLGQYREARAALSQYAGRVGTANPSPTQHRANDASD